jgi:hypothetical protein
MQGGIGGTRIEMAGSQLPEQVTCALNPQGKS